MRADMVSQSDARMALTTDPRVTKPDLGKRTKRGGFVMAEWLNLISAIT
jgi:hypothetical protein